MMNAESVTDMVLIGIMVNVTAMVMLLMSVVFVVVKVYYLDGKTAILQLLQFILKNQKNQKNLKNQKKNPLILKMKLRKK